MPRRHPTGGPNRSVSPSIRINNSFSLFCNVSPQSWYWHVKITNLGINLLSMPQLWYFCAIYSVMYDMMQGTYLVTILIGAHQLLIRWKNIGKAGFHLNDVVDMMDSWLTKCRPDLLWAIAICPSDSQVTGHYPLLHVSFQLVHSTPDLYTSSNILAKCIRAQSRRKIIQRLSIIYSAASGKFYSTKIDHIVVLKATDHITNNSLINLKGPFAVSILIFLSLDLYVYS